MAVVIPALKSCEKHMNAGEKKVASLLWSKLDNSLVWYDCPQGERRRYPDFIILDKNRGLLFLEVKDWKPETIYSMNPHMWEITTGSGIKRVAHPLEQARQATFQVLNALEKDKRLQHHDGHYRGRLVFPYGWGTVFTRISRQQISQIIKDESTRQRLLPDNQVLYSDDLSSRRDNADFQQQLWQMLGANFPCTMRDEQAQRIRWYLFPEIRVEVQRGLFDPLPPPLPTIAGASSIDNVPVPSAPDVIRTMDLRQEQLARNLGEGHRVIHGVAGSGKTMILIYRCVYLANILNRPILVLCYNITLAAYLRSTLEHRGVGKNVEVKNIHSWCAEQRDKFKLPKLTAKPNSDEYYNEMVESVSLAMDEGHIPSRQYGAVLIDEGHDFKAAWLKMIPKLICEETNLLLLLYDDAQSIYKKRNALNFSLKSVGINAAGRTSILKLNYRNSREILDFSWNLVRSHITQAEDSTGIPLIEPKSANISGPIPIVYQAANRNEEMLRAISFLKLWKARGLDWNEMAVLYPSTQAGKNMAERLQQVGIPFIHLNDRPTKNSYHAHENKLPLMTIHSSKGLEFSAVIILDATYLPSYITVDDAIRLLYVGLTRARERLVVAFHQQNELGKSLLNALPATTAAA